LNTVLIEEETHRHTTLCAEGLRPGPEVCAELLSRIERHSARAAAAAICGTLPAAWQPARYGDLVKVAARGGRPVVVDASGDSLREACRAGAAAVKPNQSEMESILGRAVQTIDDAMDAARRLAELGAWLVVGSLGDAGALALADGKAWLARPLEVPVVNPAGAGDGMVAMIALGLASGWDPPEILRRATAVAAAITTTPGTAECPPAMVDELLPRVVVERI
jgi:1-phosphofructokinase family hexose kinase